MILAISGRKYFFIDNHLNKYKLKSVHFIFFTTTMKLILNIVFKFENNNIPLIAIS